MDVTTVADFYQRLTKDNLIELENIYHNDVKFKDPAHVITGLEALISYFSSLYQNVHTCRFDILHHQQCDNKGFITWEMFLSHPKLKNGQEIKVNGTSYLEFAQGKVILQRDYFDLGEMVYENITFLGGIIRAIKNNLGN